MHIMVKIEQKKQIIHNLSHAIPTKLIFSCLWLLHWLVLQL